MQPFYKHHSKAAKQVMAESENEKEEEEMSRVAVYVAVFKKVGGAMALLSTMYSFIYVFGLPCVRLMPRSVGRLQA